MIGLSNVKEMAFLSKLAEEIPSYEHMRLLQHNDSQLASMIYPHDQLKELGVYGNVESSFRAENGKLNYLIYPLSHQLIVGSTGSGKSTGPISAQIMASLQAGCISMVVSDPKGDLYRRYASFAENSGCNVKLINLTNSENSEAIGIFYKVAAEYRQGYLQIGKGVKVCELNGATGFLYKKKFFESKKFLAVFYKQEWQKLIEQTQSEVRDILARLLPVKDRQSPHWEENSRKMLQALALALIIDQFSLDLKRKTTLNQINFSNMKKIFDSFGTTRRGVVEDKGFLSKRGEDSVVFREVKRTFFENADGTTRNYNGFVCDAFTRYNFSAFLDITLTSTLEVEDFVERPTILFIKYDEMNVLVRDFLSYLISGLLSDFKKMADKTAKLALDRPVLFILDEFSSLPRNSDIVNFVAYGRSRNIYIHYVIQDYSQIRAKYGEEANILLNAPCTMFLGSNDYNTVGQFSTQLGKQTIVSPQTVCSTSEHAVRAFEERPVVTCSELSLMEQGQAYIKVFRKNPIKASFEKCYECEEYQCESTPIESYKSVLSEVYDKCQYDVDNIIENIEDDDEDDYLF